MTEDETRPDPALVDVVAREMRQHRITITNGASKWTWGSDWVWRCGCGSGRDDSASHLWETCLDEASGHQASAVLTALSAAGRLLPEGGATREEWGELDTCLPTVVRPVSERYAIELLAEDPPPWLEIKRRTVTTWPDGSTYTSAWVKIDNEEESSG